MNMTDLFEFTDTAADPGFPVWGGGRRPPTRALSATTYGKTKELDPVGGGGIR